MLTTMKLKTPVGTLWLGADGDDLVELSLPERAAPVGTERRTPVLTRAADQLAEYFAGERRDFDLPLAPRGTPFQVAVWRALARIPFGATCSYGELARVVGRPSASRAVGAANGQNPLAIILPCHRVIGANGELTGYGGGLPLKRWLLDHEHGRVQPVLPGMGGGAGRPRARGAAR
jgi:methylated-DNA-[protein]-cysteine S-methyltransferase